MKKKIKDLTFVEITRICEKYKDDNEDKCPLSGCCMCTPPYCWFEDDPDAETEVEVPTE